MRTSGWLNWLSSAARFIRAVQEQEDQHWREQIGEAPAGAPDSTAGCKIEAAAQPLAALIEQRQHELQSPKKSPHTDDSVPDLAALVAQRNQEAGHSGDDNGGA